MENHIPAQCPGCGLILLRGSILKAAEQRAAYGPILGLSSDAVAADARAGYLGPGSLWQGGDPSADSLYLCPRCHLPCVAESDTPADDGSE